MPSGSTTDSAYVPLEICTPRPGVNPGSASAAPIVFIGASIVPANVSSPLTVSTYTLPGPPLAHEHSTIPTTVLIIGAIIVSHRRENERRTGCRGLSHLLSVNRTA